MEDLNIKNYVKYAQMIIKGFTFLIICLLLSTGFFGFMLVKEIMDDKISVVSIQDKGGYKAITTGVHKDSRTMSEVEDHAIYYLKNMFSHDEISFEVNTNKALPLVDKTIGKTHLLTLKQSGWEDRYREHNMKTNISVDSVFILTKIEPYQIRIYAKQEFMYPNPEFNRKEPFIVEAESIIIPKSEKNRFGLLATSWEFITE